MNTLLTVNSIINFSECPLLLYKSRYDSYLPGYDSSMGTVGHYVAGCGFDSTDPSRRKITYFDPNNGVYGAYGYHTVTFQDMDMATYQRGIIY